ncbi:MAG: sulfite exporter TauE/SafE family protein [Lentisphaerae bacterium]|nr:sulfite exporter TauE/SafE family protein [Lentisphaerota bacterium]
MDLFIAAIVVFLTHLLEGIAGFGGSVMALPFLDLTIGLKTAIQILCILGLAMALYVVCRFWSAIRWKEFFYIALWAGIGMPVGMILFDRLPAQHLCILLGLFMLGTGIHGNYRIFHPAANTQNSRDLRRSWLMRILLFCGGIIQGAFGSGGPFIVIYAAKALPDKTLFRVTLSLFWLVANICRLTAWSVQKTVWNMQNFKLLAVIFPVMLAGFMVGDYLHRKVSERHFRIGVYILLAVSGIFMMVNNLLLIFTQR